MTPAVSKGKHSTKFDITKGKRQGFVLSPLLFLAILDSVMVKAIIDTPFRVQWPFQQVKDFEYANDI